MRLQPQFDRLRRLHGVAEAERILRPAWLAEVHLLDWFREKRVVLGDAVAERHAGREARTVELQVHARELLVVRALRGTARSGDHALAGAERILLVSQPGTLAIEASAASTLLVVRLPRMRLQHLISQARDLPTGFASRTAADAPSCAFGEALDDLGRRIGAARAIGEAEGSDWSDRLVDGAAEMIAHGPAWSRLLQAPRAVRHAVEMIRADTRATHDAAALALSAGVTLRTLREGFLSVLGVSLQSFMQEARLTQAERRLSSGYDSRSVAQIARDAGFRTTSTFTRAYARLFGETPTQTRARSMSIEER